MLSKKIEISYPWVGASFSNNHDLNHYLPWYAFIVQVQCRKSHRYTSLELLTVDQWLNNQTSLNAELLFNFIYLKPTLTDVIGGTYRELQVNYIN